MRERFIILRIGIGQRFIHIQLVHSSFIRNQTRFSGTLVAVLLPRVVEAERIVIDKTSMEKNALLKLKINSAVCLGGMKEQTASKQTATKQTASKQTASKLVPQKKVKPFGK